MYVKNSRVNTGFSIIILGTRKLNLMYLVVILQTVAPLCPLISHRVESKATHIALISEWNKFPGIILLIFQVYHSQIFANF